MNKSRKLACQVVDSNIANDSLPTLQISVGIIALFEEKNLWWGSNSYRLISGRMYTTVVSIKCTMWEVCPTARLYAIIGKQLLISNDINRVRRAVLGLSQDGVRTDLENLSENSWKEHQSNDTKFNPPLFSLVNIKTGFFPAWDGSPFPSTEQIEKDAIIVHSDISKKFPCSKFYV